MLQDITAPYSFVESLAYDTLIAPSVLAFSKPLRVELLSELPAGGHALDVGCGGGQLVAAAAAERKDARFTGVDLSPDQVRRAKRRTRRFGDRVRIVEGSALQLPFEDGAFDLVVSVGSIKHWPDQARGLSECARVLRAGGTVAVVEADRGCRPEDVRTFVGKWRVPRVVQFGGRLFYRGFVSGLSLDLDEARTLAASVPNVKWDVKRLPGMPALILRGRRG